MLLQFIHFTVVYVILLCDYTHNLFIQSLSEQVFTVQSSIVSVIDYFKFQLYQIMPNSFLKQLLKYTAPSVDLLFFKTFFSKLITYLINMDNFNRVDLIFYSFQARCQKSHPESVPVSSRKERASLQFTIEPSEAVKESGWWHAHGCYLPRYI